MNKPFLVTPKTAKAMQSLNIDKRVIMKGRNKNAKLVSNTTEKRLP